MNDTLDTTPADEPQPTVAVTAALTAAEVAAIEWVRKSQPQLSDRDQRDLAARLADNLPALREPTKSLADNPLIVRERIARFIAKLRSVPSAERRRISGFVGQEKRELFELYKLRYVRSSLTEYRHAVRRELGDDHPAIAYLHLNETDSDAVNDLDRAQVRYRQTALRPIDPDRLIDLALPLLESTNVYEISVGLALLCGRRPYEIYKSGAIELADGDHVRFIGQAKTKDAPIVVMTIPTLVDAQRVVDAWNRLRANDTPGNRIADELDAKAVNARTAGRMKKIMTDRGFTDEYNVQLTPKDLRAAYAEIAYAYFAPPTITKLAFFHDILGHALTDETSAMSYLRFYPAGTLGDAQAQNERAKRELVIALYAERNAQTTDYDRSLRDARINAVQATLDITSRAIIADTVGLPNDPDTAAHALNVRTLKANLSPAQARLIRSIANGVAPVISRERVTIELLEARGILTTTHTNTTTQVALTNLGHELRAELHN